MGGGGRTTLTEKGEEVPSEGEEGEGPSSEEGELGETRLSKGEDEKT